MYRATKYVALVWVALAVPVWEALPQSVGPINGPINGPVGGPVGSTARDSQSQPRSGDYYPGRDGCYKDGKRVSSDLCDSLPSYPQDLSPALGGVGRCVQESRAYDPASRSYLGYDGALHLCP